MKKHGKTIVPRQKELNELLKTKRSSIHEDKHGSKAKRSRRKAADRKEIARDNPGFSRGYFFVDG